MNNDRKSIRVILTDDHAIVRAGIKQFLESDPQIRVIAEAADGSELLALLPNFDPDVLVMDIQMPAMNGLSATREIRRSDNSVGILILTAYDDPPYIQALTQAGANGYVLKTASPQEIIQAVLDVYMGKQVLDARLRGWQMRDAAAGNSPQANILSEREIEVLEKVALGWTNKAIAVNLEISSRTVQNHLANIFAKLVTESRTEAVIRALELGLISVHSPAGNEDTL